MRIIDITGTITHGMWTYGPPFPEVRIEQIPQPPWCPFEVNSWKFSFAGQTGTYLQTGLHFKKGRPALIDIPIEQLVNRDGVLLRIPGKEHEEDVITIDDLERCGADIRPGDGVIVSIGRDKLWNRPDFVWDSPYYTRAAMDWLLDHRPFLVAGDWPKWESLKNPQYVFDRFFEQGTLLLAPVVNLDEIRRPRFKLTVLPLKIAETAHTPARAVVIEE